MPSPLPRRHHQSPFIVALFLGVALALSLASRVAAQPSEPARPSSAVEDAKERAARAKELNKQGIAMLDANDAERALDYFLQSRKVLPTTKNTTNAAIALERLGRLDEALELYEELLLRFAGGLSEEDRDAVGPAMAQLRPQVGGIEVASSSGGGSVQIDGRDRGKLPLLSPIRVLPGKHALRVIQAGYRNFEATVEVGAGQNKKVDANLEAIPGVGTLLVVDTEGAVDDVFVDGTRLGVTPWEGALPAGKHLVSLRRGGDAGSMPVWIEVIEGQSAISKQRTLPLGPPVHVRVEPRTATLELEGLALGAGSWEGQLPAGSYALRASEPGYRTATRRVEARHGAQAIDLSIRLEVDPTHPRWPRDDGSLVLEVMGGGMIGPSLNGGADEGCPDACPSRGPLLGFTVGARGGYRFPVGISIEFGAGYMRMMQAIDRSETDSFTTTDPSAPGETITTAVHYELSDDILVHGPFAAVGFGYRRAFGKLHIGARASVGVLVTFSQDHLGGTAATTGASVPVFVQKNNETAIAAAPFLMPELNGGVRLGPIDLGLSLAATFFPALGPELQRGRFGATASDGFEGDPTAVENAPESRVLEGERAYGRFVVFTPMVSLGTDF